MIKRITYTADSPDPETTHLYSCPMCHANTTSQQPIDACAYCGEPVGTTARGRLTTIAPPQPDFDRVLHAERIVAIVVLLVMLVVIVCYDIVATRIAAAAVGAWAALYLIFLCKKPTP